MLEVIAPIQMELLPKIGDREGSHQANFLRAVRSFHLWMGEWDAVLYLWWLVPWTQHIRGQILKIHWTHFYWVPTMYTRYLSGCWWYSRQKSLLLLSSWSLHYSDSKITHGENDQVSKKKTTPLSSKRDSLPFKAERHSEVPTKSSKKAGPCWAPWPMSEKAKGSPLP